MTCKPMDEKTRKMIHDKFGDDWPDQPKPMTDQPKPMTAKRLAESDHRATLFVIYRDWLEELLTEIHRARDEAAELQSRLDAVVEIARGEGDE